jgi:hypothetical protein
MSNSIALRVAEAIRPATQAFFLQRRWWRSVQESAKHQWRQPAGASLCHALESPCRIAFTVDGELALEFGDPPLVALSSDAALLPTLRDDIQRLRRMRSVPATDAGRDRQAQIYRAGLLLIDALEQLSLGLPGATAFPTAPAQWCRRDA